MKSAFFAMAAASLLATAAICQVTIPPHSSIYNGFSRGFNFTANTNFIISMLDLPVDAFQAGDTAGYLVRVNGVEVLRSVGNAGPISTSLLINSGDVVDVIGNWSPAVTGNFSAHNSYGSGAPYATTILGVPHTLNRTGWQWDIGDPSYLSGGYLAPGSGSLGRVFMWTTPQSGLFPDFSATPTSGNAPLNVQFTDQSFTSDPNGILAWSWDIDNDSTPDYFTQNPSHTYVVEGIYSVALTVTDIQHGSVGVTKNGYIEVDTVDASFTFSLTGPTTVNFTDTSLGNPTSWSWDFENDGVFDSFVQNPTHTYPAPGSYDCRLLVADAISNDDVTVTIGVSILPIPPFSSTFTSSSATRGFFFQTPVKFSFTSLKVPDETAHGLQNVAVYNLGQAPPPFSATIPGTPLFFSAGTSSSQPIPCVISFDVGDWVGLLGACGDASTMRNSYGAGNFASSLFGQPVTLLRMLTQTNIVANSGVCLISAEGTASIGRVECGVSAATGLAYDTGAASSPGGVVPLLETTALPLIGATAELSATVGPADAGGFGFMLIGFGRINVSLGFGSVLVNPALALPMGVLSAGKNTFPFSIPVIPALNGAGPVNWQNLNIVPGSSHGMSLSNGQEWFLSY